MKRSKLPARVLSVALAALVSGACASSNTGQHKSDSTQAKLLVADESASLEGQQRTNSKISIYFHADGSGYITEIHSVVSDLTGRQINEETQWNANQPNSFVHRDWDRCHQKISSPPQPSLRTEDDLLSDMIGPKIRPPDAKVIDKNTWEIFRGAGYLRIQESVDGEYLHRTASSGVPGSPPASTLKIASLSAVATVTPLLAAWGSCRPTTTVSSGS